MLFRVRRGGEHASVESYRAVGVEVDVDRDHEGLRESVEVGLHARWYRAHGFELVQKLVLPLVLSVVFVVEVESNAVFVHVAGDYLLRAPEHLPELEKGFRL